MRILRIFFAGRDRAAGSERRGPARNRTRLRPGKLLDSDLTFLGDCAILDRSAHGLRVRLFGGSVDGDSRVAVFDENERAIRQGRIVWRRDGEAGIRIESGPALAEPDLIRRLSGPYYAVRD